MDDPNVTKFKFEDTQEATPAKVDTDRAEDDGSHWAASSNSLQAATVLQNIQVFFSTAGDNSIIAVLVGLAIATYVVLGRLGLLLIGIVSGVLLHAYWEGAYDDDLQQDRGPVTSSPKRRRKELNIEVASRLLQWRSVKPVPEGDEGRESLDGTAEASPAADIHFSSFRPSTRVALLKLTDAVIKDYVTYWYRPILPCEETFPLSCRMTFAGFITSLSSHLARKRPADTFLQFVTNSSSMIIVFLNELSLALQDTSTDLFLPAEEVVKNYLTSYPESNLANVLSVEQQQKKLKMVADDILANFLDRTAYDCEAVRTFLREIFAGLVLDSVIRSCSQPDFVNNWIVFLLEEGEPELMNAIDVNLGKPAQDAIALETSSSGDANNLSSGSFQINKSFNDALAPSEQINLKSNPSVPNSLSEGSKTPADVTSSGHGGSVSSMTTDGMITPTSSNSEKSIERLDDEISFNGNRHCVTPDGRKQSSAMADSHDEQQEQAVRSLTLSGASVWIDDGSEAGDKSLIRTKPSIDYALQIEPHSARQPGWMIFRNYSDFEFLHEGLATLSRYHHISFLDKHLSLPTWKGSTKQALVRSLEGYVRDALQYEQLAESERMKRFLGKESNLSQLSQEATKSGFSFPRQSTFENMGKGVLEALSNAPKGVAGSGKAVLEGVSGVFTGVGLNKKSFDMTTSQLKDRQSMKSSDTSSIETLDKSQPDYQRISERGISLDFGDRAQKGSTRPTDQSVSGTRDSTPILASVSSPVLIDQRSQSENSEADHMQVSDLPSPELVRPYSVDQNPTSVTSEQAQAEKHLEPAKTGGSSQQHETSANDTLQGRSSRPITEDETRVAVELIFAVINELYTLSSAWNIRKTLLNAAKSYIIRPGNPNLEAIRALLQESMIEAQTSDEAIAAHITKLRENSLPTPEELSLWPSPLSVEESERLRVRARKLLIHRGMPQALMSVMGAAATGEALGKVFDCLQVEEIGRGLIFALVLQALRALIL